MVLVGCGSDPGFDEQADFIQTEGAVQFINLMPDSPELTVRHGLNNTLVLFGTTSAVETRFVDRYDWDFSYLNNEGDRVRIIEREDQQISEDTISFFLMMGNVDQPNVIIVDHPLVLIEDLPTNQSEIWFASNSSKFPSVDIYLTEAGVALADASPFASVTSGASTNLFTVAPATNQRIRITEAGSENILFDSGSFGIMDQSRALFAIIDDFGPDGDNHVNVILSNQAIGSVIPDISQSSAVRLANMSSQPVINATLGPVVETSLTPGTVSNFSNITTGTQGFIVTDGIDTLQERDLTVNAGHFQTIMVLDNPDATAPQVTATLMTFDQFRYIRGRALFQFVNGSDQPIDVWALKNDQGRNDVPPIFNDLTFNTTNSVEVILGRIRFQVTTADGSELLASTEARLAEGESYMIVFDSAGELRVVRDVTNP